jgi:hypothetical protein
MVARGEDALAGEVRQAQPIEGACTRDEGGGAAIADDCVVADVRFGIPGGGRVLAGGDMEHADQVP